MCGIVGKFGGLNSVDAVIQGLSRLEYRGYDSAGVCFKSMTSAPKVIKESGKLKNLIHALKGQSSEEANLVIGHTRWATHGVVNRENAHPHVNKEFAIVHNGIIENASELKSLYFSESKFDSETDSEVFLKLLSHFSKKHEDRIKVIAESFKLLRGNSAFVILCFETNAIYGIKKGAPLVCGEKHLGRDAQFLVSSDPYALIGEVDQLYFPEDEVLIRFGDQFNNLAFYDLDGKLTNKFEINNNLINIQVSSKGNFDHFMMKEIFEQPNLVPSFLDFYQNGAGAELLKGLSDKKYEHIHIVACGTAWHAGMIIKKFIEQEQFVRVTLSLGSEFRYANPIIKKEDLGILISQSGETLDTLAGIDLLKKNNVDCISIINVEGSTLYRKSDHNFLINAGQEIGVASTKAFTLMTLTGYLLAKAINKYSIGNEDYQTITEAESLFRAVLSKNKEIIEIATSIYQKKGFIFTGRKDYYPMALEGALKLKEIAYVHAEGYAAGELKHGPIALIDEEMVNIALVGLELFEKTMSNIEEIKARRGKIVIIGPESKKAEMSEVADHLITVEMNQTNPLNPVVLNICSQLLAYHIAKLKGHDIDKPRNLAKSVTVE
jgi:glucosamine--fructose-6-phosphate aminotransferase (isomerizing)